MSQYQEDINKQAESSSESSKLPAWKIVLIVVGSVILIVILIFVCYNTGILNKKEKNYSMELRNLDNNQVPILNERV